MVFWLIFNGICLLFLWIIAFDKFYKYQDTLDGSITSLLIQITVIAGFATLAYYGTVFLFWAGWENPFSFIAKLPEFIQHYFK